MQRVAVDYVLEAPPASVLAALSPAEIVEYEGVYEVESVEAGGDETVVRASADDVELALAFREQEDGYRYEQRGDEGPFESMEGHITVEEAEDAEATEGGPAARVTATSSFTFGSVWAVVVDRFATGSRRDELRRLIENLAADLASDDAEGSVDGEDRPETDDGENRQEAADDGADSVEGVNDSDDTDPSSDGPA